MRGALYGSRLIHTVTPQQQLDGFMAKYSPEMVKSGKATLRKMRKRLPGAFRLVYDNWNGLVIGFGPTERPSDAILSILMLAGHVTLCFLQGAKLRDPHKLLQGAGNRVRHIRLKGPDDLDAPEIADLMTRAIEASPKPIAGKSRLIIKSISPKQRPRR